MKQWCLFVAICLLPALLLAQPGRKKVQEGNKLFTEEKFEEANGKYRDALLDVPESPVVNYNIAGTQYKIGKYEEALENYSKSMSPRLAEERTPEEDQLLRSQIHYNRGNTLYRMNKYPEAIREYQEALKLNPDDEDAKYNLEFVRNKLKNQSQQDQQDQQNQQNQQNQQQQQQQQQQDQQKQDEKEKQQEQENQQQDQQEEQQQQQQQEQQPGEMKEMSKEDAELILNALKEDEKDEQQKRKMKVPANARVLKDW